MIYERNLEEKRRIEKEIANLQSQINQLPEGKFICTHDGPYTKWYQSDGSKAIYIPKGEREFAEKLALKKYLSLQLKNLIQEKKAIDFYLRHHDLEAFEKEQTLLSLPEFQELLPIKPLSQELTEWMYADYEKNTKYPEGLIYKTYAGNYVRSKSEALIEMFLCKYQIPFRYECLLQLGDAEFFPDFTMLHPRKRTIYFWEHYGRMDKPYYADDVFTKLKTFASYGIVPSINLITTFETSDHPLSTEMVEKIIQHYFL